WTGALSLRDVDGDGDLDLFVGTFGGDNQLFRYDASNDMFATATPMGGLGGLWTNALAVGDTDHDGDPDLVTRDKESTVGDVPAPRENE
ncbi:MAG: FG-GAP-like repeat-containing protein, partial [Planctomycetota bacterium]|nr:FG-GAP-like repeat-containing protein [Planctomycetota bacterium]